MSITPSNQNIVPTVKKDMILSALERGVRLDGRKPNEYRQLKVTLGYAKKAEGSALVKLGNTLVLAGVKLEEDSPYPDTPNQGNLIVNVELLPLAYETFEPGPPDENSIELARIVDRSLRDSKAIDLSKLVIAPGKKVWTLWVDVYVLDYDGNILDACMLASIAAIYDTKLPKVEVEGDEIKINKEERLSIPLVNYPVVTVTTAKIGKYVVVDPNLDEESIADAKLSISYTKEGTIVGLQKNYSGNLTFKEIDAMESTARATSQFLFEELKKQINLY
ncbi:exosome complex protein Rrp42 [Sulfolobus acidocaldarius]|uniref:Exosome complex component Rrp42 n=4 Tax=Sulfolobus acidocaldarius TaxID=2285 RepID=Q4JB28_SULAC|nr:exosome complex protein Rrp42 [Sulfolobus acidocaldarius]AHC51015.1 exosome complex exonuclease [Sulfolobus acidocaldarius SUSAZ]AAY80001.1 exosome complex exonuclease RRP43-like protein [Sulfolobus acidocaldarius DSM 639]AGE70570.1 exosome complex RNA-binding protein Rrp42 [Sulfolobus acidocaldarius N8]AGE72843.1 exosome complex RNA-binding protein Rrp42 [Sulfolobus acidocaldarius Ron12/I]ALU29072.1 exonuclease [Sulfolobus acidocaldarius]